MTLTEIAQNEIQNIAIKLSMDDDRERAFGNDPSVFIVSGQDRREDIINSLVWTDGGTKHILKIATRFGDRNLDPNLSGFSEILRSTRNVVASILAINVQKKLRAMGFPEGDIARLADSLKFMAWIYADE